MVKGLFAIVQRIFPLYDPMLPLIQVAGFMPECQVNCFSPEPKFSPSRVNLVPENWPGLLRNPWPGLLRNEWPTLVRNEWQGLVRNSQKISKQFSQMHSEIPWQDMAGMRDKLIHDYLDVDLDVIWKTIEIDLPLLKEVLSKI